MRGQELGALSDPGFIRRIGSFGSASRTLAGRARACSKQTTALARKQAAVAGLQLKSSSLPIQFSCSTFLNACALERGSLVDGMTDARALLLRTDRFAEILGMSATEVLARAHCRERYERPPDLSPKRVKGYRFSRIKLRPNSFCTGKHKHCLATLIRSQAIHGDA